MSPLAAAFVRGACPGSKAKRGARRDAPSAAKTEGKF